MTWKVSRACVLYRIWTLSTVTQDGWKDSEHYGHKINWIPANHKPLDIIDSEPLTIEEPQVSQTAIIVPSAPTITPVDDIISDSQIIKDAIARLSTVALEREDAIKALFLSLIARQHLVLYGEGGTGKNWLVEHFSSMLGLNYFYYQIYQATQEAHLFGSIDYKKMHDTGEMRHVSHNSLMEAEIAFLDEIGNSSSVIRNLLKNPMEERIFKDGYDTVRMPLNTIVGASNSVLEYKKDATEAAFADRWLSRVHVQRIQQPDNRIRLLELRWENNDWPVIGSDVIYRLQSYLPKVQVSREILKAADSLRNEILADPNAGNLDVSDRRMEHTMLLVRASAILHGRLKAKRSDLSVFGLTFWNNHMEGEDSKLATWLKAKLVSQLDVIEGVEAVIDQAYQAWEAYVNDVDMVPEPIEALSAGTTAQSQIARSGESLKRLRTQLEDEDEVDAINKLEAKIAGYNKTILYKAADIASNTNNDETIAEALNNLKK